MAGLLGRVVTRKVVAAALATGGPVGLEVEVEAGELGFDAGRLARIDQLVYQALVD
jgi:hypothetical protein